MSEREGYGYGDEPAGQGPVSGRGAVTEREAAREEREPVEDEAVEEEPIEQEAPPAEPPGSAPAFEPDAPAAAEAAPAAAPADQPVPDQEPAAVVGVTSEPPAAPEPAAVPEPTAAQLGPAAALLSSIDADDVRRRFLDIQASFVDEPRQAVEAAGRFVDDLVQQVIDALASQRGQLQSPVTDGDTEQLRQALRGYRQFVDRLLGLAM
jgi:hypothetical protein